MQLTPSRTLYVGMWPIANRPPMATIARAPGLRGGLAAAGSSQNSRFRAAELDKGG
jgi:hypothetical protein